MDAFVSFTKALVGVELFLKAPQFLSQGKVFEFDPFIEDLGEAVTLVVVVEGNID